jgi:hypothetical protein
MQGTIDHMKNKANHDEADIRSLKNLVDPLGDYSLNNYVLDEKKIVMTNSKRKFARNICRVAFQKINLGNGLISHTQAGLIANLITDSFAKKYGEHNWNCIISTKLNMSIHPF